MPFKEKAFGTLPTVQTFLNPTPYPCPHPVPSPPLTQDPHMPGPSIQYFPWAASTALGWVPEDLTSRWWSQKPSWGTPSVLKTQGGVVSGGRGLERSQLWYREVGRAREEQGDTSHLWEGVHSTSEVRWGGGPESS